MNYKFAIRKYCS